MPMSIGTGYYSHKRFFYSRALLLATRNVLVGRYNYVSSVFFTLQMIKTEYNHAHTRQLDSTRIHKIQFSMAHRKATLNANVI